MESVFVVQHLHELSEGEEDVKLIGVYRSRESAHAAVDRLRIQPGFREHPRIVNSLVDDAVQGFHVDEYALDEDNWKEGFV